MATENVVKVISSTEAKDSIINGYIGKTKTYTEAELTLVNPATWGSSPLYKDTGEVNYVHGGEFKSFDNWLDFLFYNPVLDGVTDNSALLTTAMADAVAQNKGVRLPNGKIGISSVDIICPITGAGVATTLLASTMIIPLATDGSICLNVQNYDGFYITNLRLGADASITPKVNSLNTIGLVLGTFGVVPVEDVACSRGVLDNIKIYGLKQGLFAQGWLNTFNRILVQNCDLGVKLDYQNNSNIDLVIENCSKDFEFTECNSSFFPRIECEGNFGDTASTIDNTKDLTIGNYRTEQPNKSGVPWLRVGFLGIVKNLKILGGSVSSCGFGVEQIELDNVIDCEISSSFSTSTDKRSVGTTANTKRFSLKYGAGYVEHTPYSDQQQNISLNYFPDPYLSHIGAGVRKVYIGGGNRAIISKENSITRTGESAIRITCVAGLNFNYVTYSIKDLSTINSLKGKEVMLSVWVFVPDLPEYDLATPNTYSPVIALNTKLAGVVVDAKTPSPVNLFQHNAWNYLTIQTSLSSAIDEINVSLYANNSATLGTGAEFIVVDSIHLATGKDADKNIYEGRVVDSPSNPVSVTAGNITVKLSMADSVLVGNFINDTLQEFIVGDKVEYTDPIAGGFMGKVCITAGTGATAVWKDFGVIAA